MVLIIRLNVSLSNFERYFMTETKSTSQQLDEAIKAAEVASNKVEELKKLTRVEDLKIVLALINIHKFTQTDLRSVLKTRSTAKKTATGPKRKYTRKQK